MKFFGDFGNPDAGIERVPVPVGEKCLACSEPIAETDGGATMPFTNEEGVTREVPEHAECLVRSIFGSMAHLQKKCSCFGGTEPEERLEGKTFREDAKEVYTRFLAMRSPS